MSARVLTEEDLEPLRRELAELRQLMGARAGGETLTTEQAAVVAGVKPKTIRAWVEAGTLPARHRGRRLVIQRADLQAHLAGSPQRAMTMLSDLTARAG
jgi:excisionase family DNA binding protein